MLNFVFCRKNVFTEVIKNLVQFHLLYIISYRISKKNWETKLKIFIQVVLIFSIYSYIEQTQFLRNRKPRIFSHFLQAVLRVLILNYKKQEPIIHNRFLSHCTHEFLKTRNTQRRGSIDINDPERCKFR